MIDHLSNIPAQKQTLLKELVRQLSKIPGMAAIVLGGSYAAGTNHESSDLDIGLYYFEARPFAIEEIRRIAESIAIEQSVTVTNFYEWGPWVNGGAWIHTRQGKVDVLYRNLDQVQHTIAEAQRGIVQHDYDQQPTHGFYNVIYLAETQICVPLFDPNRLIDQLKKQVRIYPIKLKHNIISGSLWSAEFTFMHARSFATQGDIYNTVGCLTRVASDLTQALFALNDRYFIRDKKVMDTIATFPKLPVGYSQNIKDILACPGSTAQELTQTVNRLEEVWHSMVSLAGELYQAKFHI